MNYCPCCEDDSRLSSQKIYRHLRIFHTKPMSTSWVIRVYSRFLYLYLLELYSHLYLSLSKLSRRFKFKSFVLYRIFSRLPGKLIIIISSCIVIVLVNLYIKYYIMCKVMFYNIIFRYLITCRLNSHVASYEDHTNKRREQ